MTNFFHTIQENYSIHLYFLKHMHIKISEIGAFNITAKEIF